MSGSGGSYGTAGGGADAGAVYGSAKVLPLIGGSGGSAGDYQWNRSGGAGGGAILIASTTSIEVNGSVSANGGGGGWSASGSGGAIRLIADTVQGSGSLRAIEGVDGVVGGAGRIRIEADSNTLADLAPSPSIDQPGATAELWPDATYPTVRATHFELVGVGPVTIPDDPLARLNYPLADRSFETDDPVTLYIETTNVPVPVGDPLIDWTVTVLVTPLSGLDVEIPAVYQSGDAALSVWSATFTLQGGFSTIQVRTDAPGS